MLVLAAQLTTRCEQAAVKQTPLEVVTVVRRVLDQNFVQRYLSRA
jgi:hypothetical protein